MNFLKHISEYYISKSFIDNTPSKLQGKSDSRQLLAF